MITPLAALHLVPLAAALVLVVAPPLPLVPLLPLVVISTWPDGCAESPRVDALYNVRGLKIGRLCRASGPARPRLLPAGRLIEGIGDDLHGLELVRTVAAPNVTHLNFARG